jgi:hypothetical protein
MLNSNIDCIIILESNFKTIACIMHMVKKIYWTFDEVSTNLGPMYIFQTLWFNVEITVGCIEFFFKYLKKQQLYLAWSMIEIHV